jgi:uncharacterized protein YjdB
MKKLNKSTWTAFGIAIGLVVLAAGALIGIWVGCSPLLMTETIKEKTAAAPVPEESPEEPITGNVDFPAGSETGTITFVIPWVGAGEVTGESRSVAGAAGADVKSSRGFRNVYQLVVVDDSSPGAIWQFRETRQTSTGVVVGALTVPIVRGHTYHFLFLGGHVPNPDTGSGAGNVPTLLASGYMTKTMSLDTSASKLSLTMTPLVVDTAFVASASTGSPTSEVRQAGRLAKTVGLDANAHYTFRVMLGSRNAGVIAADDALKAAAGNGIEALTEAEKGVKGGVNYWGDLALKSNKAVFAGVEKPDFHDKNQTPASTDAHSASGTGLAEYVFDMLGVGANLSMHFVMEYAPFGLADSVWAKDDGNGSPPPTGGVAPIWEIRNGLNDLPQNADTDFAAYGSTGSPTANANGALSVGVVNPAASPHRYGVFEDNNPWPLAGTEDKNAADIDAWFTSNEALLKTGRGKYGVYTRYDETHDGEDIASGGYTITGVTVTPTPVTVKAGGSLQFTATVLGTGNPPQTVSWQIVAHFYHETSWAWGTRPPKSGTTITTDGFLTVDIAEAESELYDKTELYVYADSTVDSRYLGYAVVTIPTTAWGVTLNKSVMAIAVDDEETLTATVTPATTANKAVTWSSSNSGVAYVSQAGKVTGMAPGTAFIEVRTVEGGKTDICKVTVSGSAASSTPVDHLDLSASIGTPATGDAPRPPDAGSFETAQYSGVVTWSHSNAAHGGVLLDPASGGFWGSTVYTATVALTAKPSYTFTGVSVNAFSHAGAPTGVTNPAGTGAAITVTIAFPVTAAGSGSAGGGGPEF